MMTFWLIAAAMIAICVASVILPLLCGGALLREDHGLAVAIYRAEIDELEREVADQQLSADRHDDARVELERRLVGETGSSASDATAARLSGVLKRSGTAAVVLALLPSAAVVLYIRIGDPVAVAVERGASGQADAHVAMQGSLEFVVSRLAVRLRQQPEDAEGWSMLARSYVVLDRADDAVTAYRRALALKPRDADLLADYADALATTHDGDLNGAALQSIDAALAADPVHPKALALAASAAHERQDSALAIQYWERLEDVAEPGSEMAAQARENIGAEKMAANPANLSSLGNASKNGLGQQAPRAAGTATVLEVHVQLSPALSARTRPDEQVYIYALAANGSRVPLAVKRIRADQLPSKVRLDDSMAMTPNSRLSDLNRVIVEAHVSQAGNAQPMRGDLMGKSAPVATGHAVVDVTINDVVR
ncbi:c-type cytochrome biogenesis protein CcmI [Paraburkholderia dilworthii]|uniref:c-type cytochrome biogenesis protein CcmI n=1 Tax=Paraburkholderia dilworthii TaxID=948106 RepID=UPI00042A8E70|nr:c-type cytochrome biogenesis protein CcmI [Paraburkholderia dilworthii]